MGFKRITINRYLDLHLKNNPTENRKELKKRLINSLADYKNGVKCSCGNDIWVIGSASVGNSCFSCITGESEPDDDFEIETAIKKNRIGENNITDSKQEKIWGFYNDEGEKINPNLIQKPTLCLTCIYNDDPKEELLCNMTRFDQQGEPDFKCFAYKKIEI